MKSIALILGASIVTLMGAGCNPQTSAVSPQAAPVAVSGEVVLPDATNTTNDIQVAGSYIAYSPEALAMAKQSGGKTVIFFYASWCPSCKAADADFKARSNEVPAGVTILKTDYDTEKALKQQYGVTMQDTFIQVDSNGVQVARWNAGGEGMKALLANLK